VARLVNAFGLVLLLVLSTFVLTSLVPYHGWTGVLITAVTALSGTVALTTARARRDVTAWASRIAVVAVLLAIAGAAADSKPPFGLAALLTSFVLLAGALAVLRAVITEERVGFRTILGAVSVYITLGLLFAFLYVGIDRLQGPPFFGEGAHVSTGDFPFFSLTTLTTTGYGNLVPAGQPGKMFAVVEMLMGQIFLVTLIARLVSLWEPGRWLRHGAGIAEDPEGPA
jgi:Ion channel